jgi:hypothetical protein
MMQHITTHLSATVCKLKGDLPSLNYTLSCESDDSHRYLQGAK